MPRPIQIKTPEQRSVMIEQITDLALKHVLERLKAKPCEACGVSKISASELAEINALIDKIPVVTPKGNPKGNPKSYPKGTVLMPGGRPRDALDDIPVLPKEERER
jgi:hypothetical protein